MEQYNHIELKEVANNLGGINSHSCICNLEPEKKSTYMDILLHKKMNNGWQSVKEIDDLFKLFILSQLVASEMESNYDIPFDFPDESDFVKILWNEGKAIGFYTIKLKGEKIS